MNNGHSRTSIFLMEIIISVLLFSLASAVCVKLFVHTHMRNNDTHALTRAISEVLQRLSAAPRMQSLPRRMMHFVPIIHSETFHITVTVLP